MEKVTSSYTNEVENNIEEIIKASFKQEKSKSEFCKNKLKELYPNEKWSVIFVHHRDKGFSYHIEGRYFFCLYNNQAILINSYSKLEEKETINSQKKEIRELKLKLNEAENKSKKYISTIKELLNKLELLQNSINEKNKQINELKDPLEKKSKIEPANKILYSREEMFALNFLSMDQKIHYAIPCVGNDLFVDVEKKLYNQFPEYRETNNYFLSQGKQILRFKTLEENKVESGYPIILNVIKNQ